MKKRATVVAVTGLNATDNPGPGVSVLRCLRDAVGANYHLVGLAYDALDPGVYASHIVDDVFMVPYPSQGIEAFLARIEYVHQVVGIDVVIPTLDAELPSFIETRSRLSALGIRCILPSRAQLDARAKMHLSELGRRSGLPVPREAVITSVSDLSNIHHKVPYPFFVKGPYYGATLARNYDQALAAYYKALASWGPPIIVQECIDGEEYNVVALGDGRGGLVGAVPMKKMLLTDKGKGWAGITIKDPALMALADSFMTATQWPGGCEIEVMRDKKGAYQIIEVNPRFPAWVYLSAAAGINLPHLLVQLALGQTPDKQKDHAVGTMFVRISYDQIVPFGDFQQFITGGEILRTPSLVSSKLQGAA
jgi:carbamoyl-phosphate synthase large subunit